MTEVEVSTREAEVLAAIAEHRSNAQIGRALHISVRTVESHVSSLLRKYGVADRRELAELTKSRDVPGMSGVPAGRTRFVGRTEEISTLLAALERARLVTLLGPGGMGKTRLAAVVATEPAAPGAFVDLVPVRDGLVVRAVADAFGVTERPTQGLEQVLVERLRAGPSLLVLDNCEHLVEEVAALVERILGACPEARVLATSRERLAVPGEQIVVLPPLAVNSDAVELFTDRARAADPSFAADPADVSDVCARLDGLPLAIELAAARLGSLGLDGLRTALDDRLRLLAGGRGTDPRHRSLGAVVGWSYDLLDDEERSLFRRLAMYVGGFDLDAACATSPELARGTVADLLGRLTDKSLAVRRGARWRLLETVREFALSQLTGAELATAWERYLRWAATTAAQLEDQLDEAEWRSCYDAVVGDLRAALSGTAETPDATAHRLARSLGHLGFARRGFEEAIGHYRSAAERAEDGVAAARDLRSAADAAIAVAEGPLAVRLLLDAAERVGADGNARAAMLASAVIVINRYPAGSMFEMPARRTAELMAEAADALVAPVDPHLDALLATARAWEPGGRRIGADAALAQRAVEAARQSGDPVLIAGALDARSIAAQNAGRLREARSYALERVRLVEPLPRHDPYAAAEIVDAYWVASSTAIAVGDLPAALSVAQAALTNDPIGDHGYISLPRLIRVYALTGRFDACSERADTLWEQWQQAGAPPMEWMASAMSAAALVHGVREDGSFERWQTRALEMARTDDPSTAPSVAASSVFAEARVALHTGSVSCAADLVRRAFADLLEFWWAPYARATAAEVAVVADLEDAADWLEVAAAEAAENDWADACLTRAAARTSGDRDAIRSAAEAFGRIDARFERACTLLLSPEGVAEGRAELADLQVPVPD